MPTYRNKEGDGPRVAAHGVLDGSGLCQFKQRKEKHSLYCNRITGYMQEAYQRGWSDAYEYFVGNDLKAGRDD